MAKAQNITIALDAMGGDNAPESVIKGAELAIAKCSEVNFLIYGDENKIAPILDSCPKLKQKSEVIHTEDVISDDDKPSNAIRQGRKSSMSLAVKAVRNGKAIGAVSSGNTGALMAISKIMLRTLPGIDRPAIGTVVPTKRSDSVMLDLGANVYCDGNNLFEFAVMGDAFARTLLGVNNPSIGLLNIGSEEMKGNEAVRDAASMIRESDVGLNFYGHVEGDDIARGVVDVIVTDGFSGNIALKTAEGTAKMIANSLKDALRGSILARIGALFAKPALKALFNKFDPRLHNGAMFLGLNGIVVKSHGGTDALGFANAIGVAAKLAKKNINEEIIKEMQESGHIPPEDENGDGK